MLMTTIVVSGWVSGASAGKSTPHLISIASIRPRLY